MFYSENVLIRKGPLANIWLAAHWDRKLTKTQIFQTNIQTSVGNKYLLEFMVNYFLFVDEIVNGTLPPMALRLSGQLLLGASRIYWRKARYLLEDCNETLDRLKLNFKVDGQVDMTHEQSRAAISNITLATNYSATGNNLMLPEPDLDLDEILNMVATQQPANVGKPLNGKEHDNSINLKEKFNMNQNFKFDHPNSQNDSILQAFPMNENFEIETGRRLTDQSVGMGMSRESNPFLSRDSITTSAFGLEDPSGIEAGRRELSIASAFSPMRLSTPGKSVNESPADFDMNDNFTWDANEEQAAIGSPFAAAPFNTPPRPVIAAKNISRKRKVALDEITELSNAQIHKQVRDTSDIVLNAVGSGKRVNIDDPLNFATNETRRLSLNSHAAPENAASMLALPAFDGDLIMDAFGDLFKDNPLYVSSVHIATPARSVIDQVVSVPQGDLTSIQTAFAADMNDDHIYEEDMNPESNVPSIFETDSVTQRNSAAQVDALEIISAAKTSISFYTLVSGKNRSTVAKSFFDVLALSSKGLIRAEQSETFGQIFLTAVV